MTILSSRFSAENVFFDRENGGFRRFSTHRSRAAAHFPAPFTWCNRVAKQYVLSGLGISPLARRAPKRVDNLRFSTLLGSSPFPFVPKSAHGTASPFLFVLGTEKGTVSAHVFRAVAAVSRQITRVLRGHSCRALPFPPCGIGKSNSYLLPPTSYLLPPI